MFATWNGHRITAVDQYRTRYGIHSVYVHLQGFAGWIHITTRDIYITNEAR